VRVALVLSVAACITPPSDPARARLADLHASTLALGIWIGATEADPAHVTASLDTTDDGCRALDRDAVATVMGIPFQLFDAVLGADGSCQPEQIAQVDIWSNPIDAFPNTPVQLVIADASATWSFDFAGPTGAFALSPEPIAAGTSTVTWIGGPALTSACVKVEITDRMPLEACGAPQLEMLSDPANAFQFAFDFASQYPVAALVAVGGAFELDGHDKACRGPVRCRLEAWARATVN